MNGFFRPEARNASDVEAMSGTILRLSSRWVGAASRGLFALTALVLLLLVVLDVDETTSGPAIVRFDGATPVTCTRAGVVEAVLVTSGARVRAGDPLVRLASTPERAELARVQAEHDAELARSLRDPTDAAVRGRLATLAANLALARAHVDQSVIRAPHAGLVSDVRIHVGQALALGDPVVVLAGPGAHPKLYAFLPGHASPRLRAGSRLRLEVSGYKFAYQDLAISSVSERLVGPREVNRFLGLEVGDTLPVDGAVVIASAELPDSFVVDGAPYPYADGMGGTARVTLRRERLLFALLPPLRALVRGRL